MAERHFFELSQVLPLAFAPGRQNPQSTNPSGFSSGSDVPAVRIGWKGKGCGPGQPRGVSIFWVLRSRRRPAASRESAKSGKPSGAASLTDPSETPPASRPASVFRRIDPQSPKPGPVAAERGARCPWFFRRLGDALSSLFFRRRGRAAPGAAAGRACCGGRAGHHGAKGAPARRSRSGHGTRGRPCGTPYPSSARFPLPPIQPSRISPLSVST